MLQFVQIWASFRTTSTVLLARGNQIVKLLVEPKINEIMKRLSIKGLNLETLSAFKIKQLVLGSIPARVQGIRVYERNTARDELVLDVEVMYAGDLRVKFALQGLDCEINQVTFRGTIRIGLKPLMSTMPVVGGLAVLSAAAGCADGPRAGLSARPSHALGRLRPPQHRALGAIHALGGAAVPGRRVYNGADLLWSPGRMPRRTEEYRNHGPRQSV